MVRGRGTKRPAATDMVYLPGAIGNPRTRSPRAKTNRSVATIKGLPLRLDNKQDDAVGNRLPQGRGTKRPAGKVINCLVDAEWCTQLMMRPSEMERPEATAVGVGVARRVQNLTDDGVGGALRSWDGIKPPSGRGGGRILIRRQGILEIPLSYRTSCFSLIRRSGRPRTLL